MNVTKTILVIALVAPTALWADEVGKITANLDGTQSEWHIISAKRGDKTIMTAGFGGPKKLPSLTLQGHPEPHFSTTGVLSVRGSWFGGYESAKPLSQVEILFLPQGMSKPFYTSDQVPDGAEMVLDNIELGDETGQASGTFSGKICLVQELYEAPDMNNCKVVSGSFNTALQIR
jgi:hypothetical protein